MTQDEIDRELHNEGNCEDGCPYCIEEEDEAQPIHPAGCQCGDCEDNKNL
ncbi:hypothetical protein KAR91_12565 [Candidatus Pacearchaeota archaeon]|nr:hypothetical protein [Candidatus Pacearchaeota archaeon]